MDETAVAPAAASIGMLNERHLHASLRAHYVQPGDQTEAAVDGYIVDILRDGLIIEVQTAHFSKIARKMRELVSRHRVRLVYPVPRDRWIIKMPRKKRDPVARRRSPKHGAAIDLFDELVSFPQLIAHPNFELEVVLIEEETVWRYDSPRRWRRRGWVTVERRLLNVYETISLRTADDYLAMITQPLPGEFLTSDLAAAIARPRHLAQKAAYCLKHAGIIEKVGSRGNAILYALRRDTTDAAAAAVTPIERSESPRARPQPSPQRLRTTVPSPTRSPATASATSTPRRSAAARRRTSASAPRAPRAAVPLPRSSSSRRTGSGPAPVPPVPSAAAPRAPRRSR
jgi:hypothetical protein